MKFNDWWLLSDRAVYDTNYSYGIGAQYKNYANLLHAQFPHAGRTVTGGNVLWGDGHVSWVGLDPWRIWYNSFIYMERGFYQ